MDTIAGVAVAIRENIQKVIVGKTDVINLAIAALFSEGHILLEDVPGTGKTTLANRHRSTS
jgi:MoxR-like ATPase